jgi:MOSC domain-containing protein YiiM
MTPSVVAVSRDSRHAFSKRNALSIRLLAGLGVEGDAHCGERVKHRHHAMKTPWAPNLRQVHLIHAELFDELRGAGFTIEPGDLGENVTTAGLDLLGLPKGTRLRLGESAVVELTGLRNPCVLIDRFRSGLKDALLDRDAAGATVRKSGVMAIVVAGGDVRPGDPIGVAPPSGEPVPLPVV